MELWQLRYFLAVAEQLHYGRAAALLNVAQPSITRAVQSLERELDTALLRRDKRQVALTAAGRIFADEARQALSGLEAGSRRAQRTARGEAGRLVIGFEGSAAFAFIPRAVEAFHAKHRDISFELQQMSTADQVKALRQRRIELGFVVLPVADPAIAIERMGTESVVVAMPAGHRLMAERHVERAQLAGEALILPDADTICGIGLAIRAVFDGRMPQAVSNVNDVQLQLHFAAAGIGVALVPAFATATPRTLLGFRPLHPKLEVDIAVARLADGDPTDLAGRFIAEAYAMAQAQTLKAGHGVPGHGPEGRRKRPVRPGPLRAR